MLFGKAKKWEASIKKLQNKEISIQEFVNANENKVLFHSTPFFENEKGQYPNVLHTDNSDIVFFPAFSSVQDLKEHMVKIGCPGYIIVKGDLKNFLCSLDSHPLIQNWGVVIDPHISNSVEIPPKTRVQPKCLR